MLKINMLGGISYLPLFAPDDDKKTAAQKERDSIKVENLVPKEEVKEEVIEAKEEETIEEVVEEKEDEIEAKEDEVEELKEEKQEAKTEKDKERIQRRIDRLTKEKSDLRKENETLKAQLAAKPEDEKVLTEDEVERRSEIKANEKALQKQFAEDCEKLATDAKKIDKNFDKKVGLMAEEVGNIPSQMIGILADLPNGGAVLSQLTDNLDDAEEIYKLSPARMALRLSKISDELIAKAKKQISKVPAPKEKVSGNGSTPEVLNPKNMEDFVRIRAEQVEQRRKARLGLH